MFKVGDTPNHGAYTIKEVLSTAENATMGCVYLVSFRENNGIAVGKTFRDELFVWDHRAARKCFLREAVTGFRLEFHPNILPAVMFDVVEDRPMFFTEFCKNGDLTNDLRTGRFRRNLKPVLQLAMQFCDAMSYSRSRGVVAHRDIKPTNLFIKNGEIRIGDFGISQSAAASLPEGLRAFAGNTLSGIGTPLYMAPELWEDPTLFSEQSDIYALGLVLAEMYGGHHPLGANTVEDLHHQHLTQRPMLEEFADPNFKAVVAKCLEKKHCDRFSSFAELRESLVEVYKARFQGKPPKPAQPHFKFGTVWYYNRGLILYRLGQIADSLTYLDKAIDKNAPNPRYLLARAAINESAGNLETAVGDFLHAVEADIGYKPQGKEYQWAVFGLAGCVDLLLRLSRGVEARELADGMLSRYGNSPISWLAKANVEIAEGKYHDAIRRCDEASRRAPAGRAGSLLLKLVALLSLDAGKSLVPNSIKDVWDEWLTLPADLNEVSLTGFRWLIQRGHLEYAKKGIKKIEETFCGNRKLLELLLNISRIEKQDFEADEYERRLAEGVFC